MEQVKRPKSRNLSTFQFFEILQIEWLVADLRSRIAVKLKDKEHWKNVKEGKKQTIEAIGDRNQLPTIFTDSDFKASLEKRIYTPNTHPNFHYKDESHKQLQGYWDMLYYYKVGVEVRFERFGEICVGKVKSFQPLSTQIEIDYNEESLKLPISEVSRIL